jgi:molybdopterin-guanine dinucleotide biosynthesis protein A
MIARVTNGEHDAHDYMPAQVVAEALRRAREHTDELLVARGQPHVVPIVCVYEVRDWLTALASRVELGERLRRPPAG